jgi:hypothetical protein
MTPLVRVLVACYPAAWRRRYGDEYAQLLCDIRIHRRPGLVADSLFGAARAHGGVLMSPRSPMTATVWAAGLFTVAGLGFAKLAEDLGGRARGPYVLLVAAAAVALLALLVAAAPAARDRRAWKYAVVPVVGTALWFGVVRVAVATAGGKAGNAAGFAVIAGTGVVVVAATAWAAATALRRVPTGGPGVVARPMVAAGMAVATGAALVWGLQIRSQHPSAQGFLAGPFMPSWIAVVAALAAATALAGSAARRRPV